MTHRVCLTRYRDSPDSLREVIAGCDGFSGLSASDRVMIKPNLVAWDPDYPAAPYGVYTTSRVVEDLVVLLKEAGAQNITVAEGAVRINKDDPGTSRIYQELGYRHLSERYGVELMDLLEGEYSELELNGHKVKVAKAALEQDFFINLPVLKTHNQTHLSAGIKNLKGLLDMRSRRLCHHMQDSLDDFVAGLIGVVQPKLTIIDGIYGLKRGPFALGSAVRMDALAASRDPLAADLVAAALTGMPPDGVPHLSRAARALGRTTELAELELEGTPLGDLARKLPWDYDWIEDPACAGPPQWKEQGISGLSLPKYDSSLCTGCSTIYNPLLLLLGSCYQGKPFDSIQVLTGKRMRPAKGFKHTVLLGNCMIKRNRKHPDLGTSLFVPGCPPPMKKLLGVLEQVGLQPDVSVVYKFRKRGADRYLDNPEFDPRHFYFPPAAEEIRR